MGTLLSLSSRGTHKPKAVETRKLSKNQLRRPEERPTSRPTGHWVLSGGSLLAGNVPGLGERSFYSFVLNGRACTVAGRRFPSTSTLSAVPGLLKSRNGNPKAMTRPSCGERIA